MVKTQELQSVTSQDLQISVISDAQEFAAMTDEWRAFAATGSACFFMSWEWHYTWWQVYSEQSDRLYLVRFTHGDTLVGLLPLYARRHGLSLKRTLMFLGTGEAREDEVATEYLDIIAHPNCSAQVADAAVGWLSECAEWGSVELRYLLDDALLVQAYRARSDLFVHERSVGFRYRVDLAGDEQAHMAKFSSSRRKRIERSRRALVKDGGLKQVSVTSHAELSHAISQLAQLNHERQSDKARKSVFASTKFKDFHQRLVSRVFDSGTVNVHQFTLGPSLLAAVYCFYDQQTCYYYQSGFSKRAANRYMPLTFAHLAEAQRNREAGRKYYDLMRAEPPSYKEDFGCESTPMLNTFIFCSHFGRAKFTLLRTVRRKLVSVLKTIGISR